MPLSQLILPQIKKTTPKTAKKLESVLYRELKQAAKKQKRKLVLTRLETWATAGVPDLLICDDRGLLHMVELKFSSGNVVRLSPHQVSWLTQHKHSSSWVLVKKQSKKDSKPYIFLYKADSAISLSQNGLKTKPFYTSQYPLDWNVIFNLISPLT